MCSVHAEARAASLSSSAEEMERTTSQGANLSVTVRKWTATRAARMVSNRRSGYTGEGKMESPYPAADEKCLRARI